MPASVVPWATRTRPAWEAHDVAVAALVTGLSGRRMPSTALRSVRAITLARQDMIGYSSQAMPSLSRSNPGR